MTITQFSSELDISRTQYYAWRKEGMPSPPDVDGARRWMRQNKAQRTRGLNTPLAPKVMSPEMQQDFVDRLRQFLADGAGAESHPDHETFIEGIMLLEKFGR